MAERRDSWFDIFRALGQAFAEVLRAELGVLTEQWRRWGARAAIALGMVLLAAVLVLIYLPGLLIFALIDGLHTAGGWPLWGAALGVAVAAVLLAMGLALAGYYLVRSESDPVKAAQGRIEDHMVWWRSKMLEGSPDPLDTDPGSESRLEGDQHGAD